MSAKDIRTMASPKTRMIYAYTLPDVKGREGWIKIGQTGGDVERRIGQQLNTAAIAHKLEWSDYALYRDGEPFSDKDFHQWLTRNGAERLRDQSGGLREWFKLDGPESRRWFERFVNREIIVDENRSSYILRAEQARAVEQTKTWFESGEPDQEFLWNAKPRFGKTLTAYALIEAMGFNKVLVVSNRPSVANSWAEDFFKFLSWKKEYSFVSDNDALKKSKGVLSRREFAGNLDVPRKMIAFESLQGLKNSVYFGGYYGALRWIADLSFDLLIVDESHEGVDTLKTDLAFENIERNHTLYLSGTPFRQLASARFSAAQIYNWSYADEQEAKANWSGQGANPYESLPRLRLFTYQMSEIIRDKARKGIVVAEGEDAVEYAFDLNEFFLTGERGDFVHDAEVRKFVRALATGEKYPFATPEARAQLAHTMWYLNRVASARALKKILEQDEIFKDYKIIVAAGEDDEGSREKSFNKVKQAIRSYPRTITLTVGQLTTGVTIPEWSAVLMLCNLASPAAYLQAAFRAQNPWRELVGETLKTKENAYVFDFDTARTLVIYDEFANNLSPRSGEGEERAKRIKRLLNFLPVIGEDEAGEMVEPDAAQVLAIPRRLKSREVVERGFMSNFLFQNIGAIFAAPEAARGILAKLPLASEEKRRERPENLDKIASVPADEEGKIKIPEETVIGRANDLFGPKIYEITARTAEETRNILAAGRIGADAAREVRKLIDEKVRTEIIAPVADDKDLNKKTREKLAKKFDAEAGRELERVVAAYERERKIIYATSERELGDAANEEARSRALAKRDANLARAEAEFKAGVVETVRRSIEERPASVIREAETIKATEEKKDAESEIRARLRGFARTIPSFIMAYGDDELRLANFDKYVSPEVFKEVAVIELADFVFLRDGGEYENPQTGAKERFAGHVFDETVFDDSVREFLRKKRELADYFRVGQEEDIFDYIPPQRTNQIFTPRALVAMMVDRLEEENPGCFDDPNRTFADLYMKSGLYIAEIVRRLYRSEGLKTAFPEDAARLRHIFANQVYGLAPTEILYNIAANFLLGFADGDPAYGRNFRRADAARAAREGKLGGSWSPGSLATTSGGLRRNERIRRRARLSPLPRRRRSDSGFAAGRLRRSRLR